MSSVKRFRESLGLSQQALGEYLQVDRGVISMTESGRRELPTSLTIPYLRLVQAASESAVQNTPPSIASSSSATASSETLSIPTQHLEAVQAQLKKHAAQCVRQLERTELQLQALEADIKTAQRRQATLQRLKELLPSDADYERAWIEAQERDFQHALSAERFAEARLLKLRLETLAFQLTIINKQ
jgi:transcriptional regulator with XRE-family HTH domain